MRRWVSVAVTLALLATACTEAPRDPSSSIRIGEINSYSAHPAFTLPYRNGWRLGVEEVNAAGGVLGKRLEVLSRDDAGKSSNAISHAAELLSRERVRLLCGTFLSNIGLAVSDFARRKRVLFIAAEPLTTAITWEQGHRYAWRLRPSTYMQNAMLAEAAAKLPAKRWATIAPNYEYGHSSVEEFEKLLKKARPDVEFVHAQWPPQGKLDAGATVQSLENADPDAIYNATFAGDLAKLVREGTTRGLFENRHVVSLLTGEPEYLEPLRQEAPEGWWVTGYPWAKIETVEHQRFLAAYRSRFDDTPKLGSVVGYTMIRAIAAMLESSGSTETETMLRAMAGLRIRTPFGEIVWRSVDHQATMGAFVGRTAVENGRPTMVDWYYADGADYLPTDEVIRSLRPTP